MAKKFESSYGYFTEDGQEFVITNFKTPRPWINVISNRNYGLVISQLGGGFSWITHSNLNRLTRWQQDLLRDDWGKYFYLRDEESGSFWSPTIQPVLVSPSQYECRHGIGYTTFFSEFDGIVAQLRVFVPPEENMEIWTLELQNKSGRVRRMGVYTYLEWGLGAGPDMHREFHKTFIETEFSDSHQALLARKRLWEVPSPKGHWNTEWPYFAFFACNQEVDGYEGDKEAFIGNTFTLQKPRALVEGELSNTVGKWGDAIASLHKILSLPPNTAQQMHFFLGAAPTREAVEKKLEYFREAEKVEEAFQRSRNLWKNYLDATQIETPDDAMNIMTNVWLKYQAISGRIWGRAAYYQQSGAYGFRDQLQDSGIFLSLDPEQTKKQLHLHAAHQFSDGRVLHWWHPITEEGLDAGMSDDLLWLPFMMIDYLKETADWAFLQEEIPFYDQQAPASMLKHCLIAINKVLSRLSPRGLPLILAGDWNDGLSAVGIEGRGESVWLAHFLFYTLTQFSRVLRRIGDNKIADEYSAKAEQLKSVVNKLGWDGSWFWRARKDAGELIGSRENKEGRIFLNAQTWAIISGIATTGQEQKIQKAIQQHLETPFGPLLFEPAYTAPDREIGYLSRYAPGVRENGGIYTHAATWAIWAACMLSDPDMAYRIYQNICPVYKTPRLQHYYAEPYVTPGNIDGKDSPHFGRGGWTWYTGSAAWLYRVTLEHILGIQADFDGLLINPCLPGHWKTVTVKRLFRASHYHIRIQKTKQCWEGELTITVEGKQVPGNRIPPKNSREPVHVEVKLL